MSILRLRSLPLEIKIDKRITGNKHVSILRLRALSLEIKNVERIKLI
jgi:hypothetical protein